MNEIDTERLEPELLAKIEFIKNENGYESIEQTIKAMLTEQASIGVGVVTGDADLRNVLSFNNCNTKRYGADYER